MNRRNVGYTLALAALLISIPRYIAAFEGIDHNAWTAYGMGILLAGGAAYIFDAWADARRRGVYSENRNILLLAFGINLLYEPFILTPLVLSRLWSQSLADAMSNEYAVFWSVLVAAAPVILVAGLVLAINHQRQPNEKRTNPNEKRTNPNEKRTNPNEPGSFTCSLCGRSFRNQNGLNSHQKVHKTEEETK